MTIVAGFVHRDGVLLCADTQMESGAALTHAPKIGAFDFAGGKVAIAFAGNTRSAEVTIQKLAKVLRRLDGHEDVIAEFEGVLDTVIRSRKLPPSRSSFQAMSVSPCSSFFKQRSKAGRLIVGPDRPSSLKTVLHPAFCRAASCRAGVWSSVETRA